MTTEQMQHYLCALGYSIECDNQYGPATREAVRSFQRDYAKRPDGATLVTDGWWGPKTEKALREVIGNNESKQVVADPSKGYRWINRDDFKCRCHGQFCNGWPDQPHKKTMDLLEQFGEHFQKRPVVHSGLRCRIWNQMQGGAPNSKHMYGMAVDFHINGVSNEQLREYAETLMPGWGGIGIYSWGIHIDDRQVKGRWDMRGK